MDKPFLNLSQDFKFTDFMKILNENNFTQREKFNLQSIFNRVSQMDGTIDSDELKQFNSKIDQNSDGKLSDNEITSSLSNIFAGFQNYTETEIKKFFGILKLYIKTTNEQNQKYKEPTVNEIRFDKNDRAGCKFCEQWLEEDAYGSQTFEEWMKNNSYEYDQKAIADMLKKINKIILSKSETMCSKAVTDTLQNTFVKRSEVQYLLSNGETVENELESDIVSEIVETHNERLFHGERQRYAYNNASEYANNPNFKEVPYNIVKSMDLRKDLPEGCIIVYDAGYKDDVEPHKYGHIGISDGKGHDLSFVKANIVTDHQEDHIRIFVPIIPDTKQA
ncbi:MAG: hypothetical protein MJ231_00395 [bacterium]|nr:hypothetical protein [bacterium]